MINTLFKTFFISILTLGTTLGWAAPSKTDEKATKTVIVPASNPWDYDFHIGAGFGTFKNKEEIEKTFGGFLMGLSLYDDHLFESSTAFISADFLIDAESQQIARKSFGLGSAYALIGGKKRTISRLKVGTAVTQNLFALNWVNRLNYESFSLTPQSIGIESIEGAQVAWSTGLGVHWMFGLNSSLSLILQQTVLSFSASIEKSTASSTEVLAGWRAYL